MDFKAYIENANLGPLVAVSVVSFSLSSAIGSPTGPQANYIIVEEGTASASATSTAPVNSATLAAGAGSSGVSSGGVRPTTSGGSGSNAPQPTEDGSAAKVSTWAAPVVALFGGLAVLAL
jgi:hypothetical protein